MSFPGQKNSIYLDKRRDIKTYDSEVGEVSDILANENNGLILVDKADSIEKTKIVRYRETFKGIPVYDAFITTEIDSNTGSWTGQISGEWYEDLERDIASVVPLLSKHQALALALSNEKIQDGSNVIDSSISLVIVPWNGTGILCYDITLLIITPKDMQRPGIFINANSGLIFRRVQRLRQSSLINAIGGNLKTEKIIYGKNYPPLNVESNFNGTVCSLKSKLVRVYDLKSALMPNRSKPFRFLCNQSIQDEVNGGYSPMSDAFYMSQRVFEMFDQWAHVSVIRNPPIDIWVHYGKRQFNAMYNGKALVFGDGNEKNFPLVTYDIVAHEFAHVFTESYSNLEYENQSGAINEAFSDLVGETFEFYMTGINDFHIGAKTDKINEEGIRDICNQQTDGLSIVHVQDYYDGMEVHLSSGIFNKVSCILMKNPNIGLKVTFQIYTHANRFYWGPVSNFSDAVCGILKAAYDLGHDTNVIREAFSVVGLNGCNLDMYIRKLYGKTHIQNLMATKNEKIMLAFDGQFTIKNKFIRVFTEGGAGDVDLYLNYNLILKRNKAKYVSVSDGNLEVLQIPAKKCRKKLCYIHLLPKEKGFSGVSLWIDVVNS